MNDDEDERTTQFSIYICPNEALRILSSGKNTVLQNIQHSCGLKWNYAEWDYVQDRDFQRDV